LNVTGFAAATSGLEVPRHASEDFLIGAGWMHEHAAMLGTKHAAAMEAFAERQHNLGLFWFRCALAINRGLLLDVLVVPLHGERNLMNRLAPV
jgi:hypothetical protein